MTRRVLVSTLAMLASLTVGVPTAGAAMKDFFGVIAQTPLEESDIPLLQEAKPGSVRYILFWPYIQSQKGPCLPTGNFNPGTGPGANNCNWAYSDHIVGVAATAGVRTFPYVFGTPSFLNSAKKGSKRKPWVPPLYSKSDKQAWSNFVHAAVDRYGRGGTFWDEQPYSSNRYVKDWQVWNEPSSPAYFSPRPDPGKYGALLKLSAKAIRSADQQAKVVTAGVFGTPRRKGGGIDMPDWYERLYKVKGIEKAFDLIAMHPYAPDMKGVKLQIELLRDVMKDAKDASTKVSISEIGWASGGPKGHTLSGTPKSQARRLKQAFKLLKQNKQRWKIEGVNWFSWRDAPENQSSCASCPFAGLLKLNGDKKPAFQAFKGFT